jgi:hypothetical protein
VQAVVVAATKGSLYVLRLTAESMRRDHEPPREQVRDLRPEILTHSMQAERSIPAAVPAPVSTFTSSVWSTDLASASPGVALAKRHTLTLARHHRWRRRTGGAVQRRGKDSRVCSKPHRISVGRGHWSSLWSALRSTSTASLRRCIAPIAARPPRSSPSSASRQRRTDGAEEARGP